MKIKYNNREVLELSKTQQKVIKNDLLSDGFEADMMRRCKYWLEIPVDKYIHRNKTEIVNTLRQRGMENVPINSSSLMAAYSERLPPPLGLEDIQSPVPCQVGDHSFELSMDYCKGWRKLLEERQTKKSKEEYLGEEDRLLASRMAWILQHKYDRCYERLQLEWLPKLEARNITEVPTDPSAFAELVFSQPDYKDRETRDRENPDLA